MPTTPPPWPAPAKLNLLLHIVGRREDGYHRLQTVFHILEYGDELTFVPLADSSAIQRDYRLRGVSEEQDLILRAARLLQAHTGVRRGVRIGLTKRLPQGGGLGGGSSDAATTLVALNRLWECGLDTVQLAGLGLQLGADVPLFIHGHSAWAEGVGEELTAVELDATWYVVLIPPISVSTAEVFSHPQLIRNCPPITIRDFLAGRADNVCEPVVRLKYPVVDRAMNALSEFSPARLTGTGACIFAGFETAEAAQRCWSALRSQWQGFLTQGLNLSPLHRRLAQE